MSYKTYRMIQAFNGMVLGGIIGASVSLENWIVPLCAVIVSISLMMVLRRRVKEIVADERTYAIAGKAARITMMFGVIGMAFIGAIFLVVSRGGSPGLTQAGFALMYAACALLVINCVAYYYYSKRLGGR
jgi:uncharacterized membrane protein